MPRIPVIQHQKMAPGPPRATAVETPMMLPVPRVAARVVALTGTVILGGVKSIANICERMVPAISFVYLFGCLLLLLLYQMPVTRHMTTVSQNTAVMET